MAADDSTWGASGPTSLESRFFVDDGAWNGAPMLTGQTSSTPLPDVKNILVTGGEGFIGSWLVRHLSIKYQGHYNIVSFDKLDYCSSLNNARLLQSKKLGNFHFFHGDVTIAADVIKCLQKHNIDTVFHLAAHTHVDLSFGNSYKFTMNNVVGTHVLLESIKEYAKVQRYYHISTDEVYGEALAANMAENNILEPTNPYSASKAAAEMMVKGYVKSHGLPAVMIRLNNVMGPHQYPEKVIPKFISLLRRGRPLLLHGDGQHSRRYLYAGDAAEAFDTILHKGEIGETYNVDSRDEVSNLQLAEKLLGLFDLTDKAAWIQHTRDRKFNDRRYAVDGSKLQSLGWKQRTSFDAALRMTVDWYGKFADWSGDIEGVLTAHPVVKGDHVVQPAGVAVSVPQADGHEATAGALDKFVMETKASALDGFLMMETDSAEDAQPKVKAMSAGNGGSHNGGKKGKADADEDAEDAQPTFKAMPAANVASNGGSKNGGKKRKADRISDE